MMYMPLVFNSETDGDREGQEIAVLYGVVITARKRRVVQRARIPVEVFGRQTHRQRLGAFVEVAVG